MIEKLKRPVKIGGTTFRGKINELVDTVNNIVSVQEKLIDSRFVVETKRTEPDGDDAIQEVIHADYYAEQKKWIGKLCRFWNFNKNDGEFNILISINKESKPLTFVSRDVCEYTHCEPVSPDDDIIYKKD